MNTAPGTLQFCFGNIRNDTFKIILKHLRTFNILINFLIISFKPKTSLPKPGTINYLLLIITQSILNYMELLIVICK